MQYPSCSLPVVCLNQFNKAWLNFDLGEVRTVSSVITTGRPGHNQWVKKYTISVSDDGSTFIDAPCLDKDSNGYCNGNTDMTTQVTNVLAGTIKARYVRLNVKENNGYSSLRMAVSMEKKPIKEYEFRTVDCSSSGHIVSLPSFLIFWIELNCYIFQFLHFVQLNIRLKTLPI